MADRHDALAAAAELVLALEAAARDTATRAAPATVATVGALDVEPGAISVIPARVRAALEVRGIDAAAIAAVEGALDAAVAEVAARRGVTVDPPAPARRRPDRAGPRPRRAARSTAAAAAASRP